MRIGVADRSEATARQAVAAAAAGCANIFRQLKNAWAAANGSPAGDVAGAGAGAGAGPVKRTVTLRRGPAPVTA